MTAALADLPAFEAPAFASDLVAMGAPAAAPERAPLPLCDDPRRAARIERRRMIELKMGEHAAAMLATLPAAGEAVHVRMDGSFNGFDFVPAILRLLKPATIEDLHLASLSFNRRVGERLLELVDAGRVRRCVFLSSEMFQGKERHLVDWLAGELARRGSRLAVARNHCKLLLATTTDGRHLAMEGSHNLRTCRCYEQATFWDDADLHAWHRRFIESC